jgi:trigger factor
MQIKELEKKDLIRKFHITIPTAKVEKAIEDKAADVAKTAKIDGFRAGKVPTSVIKQKYSDSLKSETLDLLMKSSSKEIVSSNNFVLSSTPRVHNVVFEDKKDLTFDIEMELLPTIPEIEPKEIKLQKNSAEIGKKEIEETLAKLAGDFKTFKPLEKTALAKNGDTVLIDATGSVDGEDFPEGKVTAHHLTLGSKQFIPGFEDGLVGLKAGDKKTLDLKFPKDYWKEELKDKSVSFNVEVKEVSKEELPKIDDALAQKLQLKDEKELRSKVMESLNKYHEDITVNLMKKELFDHLEDKVKFSVPTQLVKKELEHLNASNKDNEEENKSMATRRVKIGLILSDIAKQKKINVSQDEVRQELGKQLQAMPGQQDAMLEYYKNNPEALEGIKGKVLEDKSVEFLLKEVSITEQKVTPEELTKLFQDIK